MNKINRPALFYLLAVLSTFSVIFGYSAETKDVKPAIAGAQIYQTAKSGDNLADKGKFAYTPAASLPERISFTLNPDKTYQSIVGFGAAFTESSASLYKKLGKKQKKDFINSYFSTNGAGFTLMRTHIGSCDFSLSTYDYAPDGGDTEMASFTIDHDKEMLIPLIRDAMAAPGADFKIISSPWSPPPWMKNNMSSINGILLPMYYPAYALYLSKYLKAYLKEGIPIWGMTVQNEPLHGGDWESCKWTPAFELDFIKNHLGPLLKKENQDVKILIYDHNKDNMLEWAYVMMNDPVAKDYVWGTAVHWYATYFGIGTNGRPHFDFDGLQAVHEQFPDKHIINTEACTFGVVTNGMYWNLCPDWSKYMHIPAERYGVDIIGDLNNWAEGWVEWNILLNMEGLPNSADNANSAPVMMDEKTKKLCYNPSYYILEQFSKFIRPGAVRIDMTISTNDKQPTVIAAAFKNTDGRIVIELLNTNKTALPYQVVLKGNQVVHEIEPHALQTIVLDK